MTPGHGRLVNGGVRATVNVVVGLHGVLGGAHHIGGLHRGPTKRGAGK